MRFQRLFEYNLIFFKKMQYIINSPSYYTMELIKEYTSHLERMDTAMMSLRDCCREVRQEHGPVETKRNGIDRVHETTVETANGTYTLVDHAWRVQNCAWDHTTYLRAPVMGIPLEIEVKGNSIHFSVEGQYIGSISSEKSENEGLEVLFMHIVAVVERDLRSTLPKSSADVQSASSGILHSLRNLFPTFKRMGSEAHLH